MSRKYANLFTRGLVVEAFVDRLELGIRNMGVNLSSGDVGVAEEALDTAEVGAVLKQIGGKTVTQGVGCDVFGDAGGFGVAFH